MTRSYLTAEIAARIIGSAFAPLRCVAEPWDYGDRIRFQVSDSTGKPALTVGELLKREFSNPRTLESDIKSWRNDVTQLGLTLDPWTFPTATQ